MLVDLFIIIPGNTVEHSCQVDFDYLNTGLNTSPSERRDGVCPEFTG